MAKCKICGGVVRTGEVLHKNCRKRKVDAIMAAVCDEYCRFPTECADEDELHEKHCDSCKIAELLGVIKSATAPEEEQRQVELKNENGEPVCVTGKSPSGLCSCCRADGKVCCIGCKEDCNIRCGWVWIDEEE